MLYLCPTPIGNLRDVTLRVLDVLGAVDVVACEDTRRTRTLLARYELHPPRLISFHEHNEEAAVAAILGLLGEGLDVALVTDAGMPGLSDPGFRLVRACAAEGVAVTVLPGPSAISTGLVSSGLPTDRFVFVGFLPRGKNKLVTALEEADRAKATVVAFESPRRIRATLAAVGERWPERRLAVCRELTKVHEEVLRGTAGEVSTALAETVKGEIVLVLEPAGPAGWGSAISREAVETGEPAVGVVRGEAGREAGRSAGGGDLESVVTRLLTHGLGTKGTAGVIAELTGMPAREAYELAVAVRGRVGGRADG